MFKKYLFILEFVVIVFLPAQIVKSEAKSEAQGLYVTTEDIISDIIFPTVDERVIEEYGGDQFLVWNWKRIVNITYNDNHSYDVTVSIEIPPNNPTDQAKEDLVKIRISPSCDSEKINQEICHHEFKIEILDYEHLSP